MEEKREEERGWRRTVRAKCRAGLEPCGILALPLSSSVRPWASSFKCLAACFLIYEVITI